MSEWRENTNGNFVYLLDSDMRMTVFQRNGQWQGVYDERFTEEAFQNPEQAMTFMEAAVLSDRLDLLVKRRPKQTGWRKTKVGSYQCTSSGRMMTVKQADSGKWYVVIDQTLVRGRWFNTSEDAMREADQL